ncbi:biotin-dependent carboxyltransferase family protein [Trujillonella humicola]|uniref:5-oxoprolinase subunit C family protein n=1 Tax=Trujillonella humicola TaxID=3383699 RepID=UPI003905CDB7
MSGAVAAEVIDPGLETTVQSWPGRIGMTSRGYFPAGPADHYSARAANVLVGNPAGAAALEIPMIRFEMGMSRRTRLAFCGPESAVVCVNGEAVPTWATVDVAAGDIVSCREGDGPGFRMYVAFAGGLDVPVVQGSTSTHLIGGIGGVQGRALLRGDVLSAVPAPSGPAPTRVFPTALRPVFGLPWEIEVLRGPHSVPDFLTPRDWEELTSRQWRVDLNSDRVATRLEPFRFRWSRPDGGVAGGHPSNVLDSMYPLGAVLATSDVLTVLGPEGNTSGGFAVVATVPHCARWKFGQIRPGRDSLVFREVGYEEALALGERVDFALAHERLAPET